MCHSLREAALRLAPRLSVRPSVSHYSPSVCLSLVAPGLRLDAQSLGFVVASCTAASTMAVICDFFEGYLKKFYRVLLYYVSFRDIVLQKEVEGRLTSSGQKQNLA